MRLAVIDLRSSSFALLVAEITPPAILHRIDRARVPLRLGRSLAEGYLPETRVESAVQAARHLHHRAFEVGAERVVTVATETLRQVANGSHLVSRIADAIGEPVHLLSGIDEARLAFVGIRAGVAMDSSPILTLDLGGGSLELATGDRHGVDWAASIDLGVLRIIGELVADDPPTPAECRAVARAIRERLFLVARRIPPDVRTVASGGTVRGMARIIQARRGGGSSFNRLTVDRAELTALRKELLESPLAERLTIPGMRERLAEILPVAAVILTEVLDRLRVDRVTITEWGMREGMALAAVTDDVLLPAAPVIA